MMRVSPSLLLALLLSLLAGGALAQQPSQTQANAIKQNCRGDYPTYCGGVPTGGMASLQCLQQHLSQLSPPCQSSVAAVSGSGGGQHAAPPAAAQSRPPAMSPREEMAIMRGACGGDFRAYCQGVGLGGGRALACLSANEARLSRPCKAVLARARAAR